MKKYLFIICCLFIGLSSNAQNVSNDAFARYAQIQDSLMHEAYYHKDIKGYHTLLNDFLSRYNKLSAADKENFNGYKSGAYYNLACAYALKGDKKNALVYLKLSKYDDYSHMLVDTDLDTLRNEPEFKQILNQTKKLQSKYLTTLRTDDKYNAAEHSRLPKFTYQSSQDSNLAALRRTFNLDSIAGTGSDVTQIINLMRWVHNLIPHDGNKGNPDIKNAMSMIGVCKRDNKTLNCRGLAILLNEVYLAKGFQSRFVTCLPKDTTDQDCHVITMVYSKSLRKWVWMDPTFEAYVMNEDGELLGIEEVRYRLIHDKPLILNPDANHNHQNDESKQDYLGYYMAKNLYKIECPVSSEYNYETPGEGKKRQYMLLMPGTKAPLLIEAKNTHGVVSYAVYSTNNPAAFWAAP